MKKIYNFLTACALGLTISSCDDFLDYQPTAVIDEETAFSYPDEMVTAAYAMLGDCWYTYPFNLWPYGDLTSDDCLKGGWGTGDTNYHHLEIWSSLTSRNPDHMDELWYRLYCAVSRCNRALVSLQQNGERVLGADVTARRIAEVRFLRAHFYYKLITVWYQVPWVDEVAFSNNTVEQISNTEFTHEQLMLKLIDEFQAAYDVLPTTQQDGGRVNNRAMKNFPPVVVVCFGSPSIAGDSLGPEVGSLLRADASFPAFVYGTLDRPITGKNMGEWMNFVREVHSDALLLAVDACLGERQNLGRISVRGDGVCPAAACGKKKRFGDVGIIGVVGDKTGDPLSELMQADLAAVSALARQIAALIKDALSPARSFSAASDF